MISTTAVKYGIAGLMSFMGVSGYAITEKFQSSASEACISSSEENSSNRQYHNGCSQPMNTMICEEYGFHLNLFFPSRGMKSCFAKAFAADEKFSPVKISESAPTKISIVECRGQRLPTWLGSDFGCF